VIWEAPKLGGLKWKVLIPLVGSPVAGFIIGFALMLLIFTGICPGAPWKDQRRIPGGTVFLFRSNGIRARQSDAQKSMGIITMALIAFGSMPKDSSPPLW